MPFAALATVELQLIMRCCDRVSLLALARCSRTTLTAASSDFAWRCLSPVRVRSDTQNLAQQVSSSLLRHVDVCVWLTAGQSGSPFTRPPVISYTPMSTSELQDILMLVPHLRGVDCSRRYMSNQDQLYLLDNLTCPLEEFITFGMFTLQLLRVLLERQPLLQILDVTVDMIEPEELANMAQLQQLTDLRVSNSHSDRDLSGLSACRSLRSLSLTGSIDRASPTLLMAPALLTLRSLQLHFSARWPFTDMPAWDAAFANQRALDSLIISNCVWVDALLGLAARHCLSLCTLTVRWAEVVDPADVDAHDGRDQPTLSALRDSLQQLPSMRLQLDMPSRSWWISLYGDESSVLERWDLAHAAFMQLALDCPGRVHIILFDE